MVYAGHMTVATPPLAEVGKVMKVVLEVGRLNLKSRKQGGSALLPPFQAQAMGTASAFVSSSRSHVIRSLTVGKSARPARFKVPMQQMHI